MAGERRGGGESDSSLSNHNLVKFADEEAYFLLWAGDFSPASPSSSAWTCRSWSPQKYQACQTWLKIWGIAVRHRSDSDLKPHLAQSAQISDRNVAFCAARCTRRSCVFREITKRRARVSVEGRCLMMPSTERNTYTQQAFEGKTRQQKKRPKRLSVISSFVRPRLHFACRPVPRYPTRSPA